MDFNKKVVIVTGGAKGIGEEVATSFNQRGSIVHIFDVDTEEGKNIEQENQGIYYHHVDITNFNEVKNEVNKIEQKYEAVDVLVNNAGISNPKIAENMSVEEWTQVLNVNLTGAFHCCKAVIEPMKRNKSGKIVNISSLGGIRISYAGGIAYSASKAGLLGMTRHLAYELIPFGINVNSVCPGGTMTPLYESLTDSELIQKRIDMIPAGRLCSTEDIANAVLFLASEHSDMICGVELPVDGGSLLGWLNIKDYYNKRQKV